MIYLAGPLFTIPERLWNKELSDALRRKGFDTFLPQEDCSGDNDQIFKQCVGGLESSAVVLANVDGTDPDSGTCFELGYAYATKKPIILYRTDFRCKSDDGSVNLMLSKSCKMLFMTNSVEDLVRRASSMLFVMDSVDADLDSEH